MKNLIDKIIEIDHTADERLKEAEQRKAQALKEIDARKAEIMKEITMHGDTHLTDLEKTESASAQKQIQMLDKTLQENKKTMESLYEQGREKWVRELTDGILSR
ncbi:MAG TPA: hypothetical protein H9662_01320 [Firmicutes bacterium]|nr:hypothetical protein [Bacillota bacterium]